MRLRPTLPGLLALALAHGPFSAQAQLPTLDPVFATNGVLSVPLQAPVSDGGSANLLALQGGSYLAIGEASYSGSIGIAAQGVLVKFDACGALDPTFGTSGVSQLVGGVDWRVLPSEGVQLTDGSILLAGTTNTGFGAVSTNRHTMVKVLPDGTLDATYGAGGFLIQNSSDGVASSYGTDLLALPSGGFVATAVQSGNINGGSRALSLFGYLADGDVDASFGTGGAVHVAKPEFAFMAQAHLTNTSTILVAYGRRFTNNMRIELSAFTLEGEPIITFGNNGNVDDTTNFLGGGSDPNDFASVLDDAGRLTVMGALDQDNIQLIRFLSNGSRDLSFGTNGRLLIPHLGTNLPPDASNLKILADGSLLALVKAGTPGNTPGTQWFLLSSEGELLANDNEPWLSLGFNKASDVLEIEEGRWLVLSASQFPAGMAVRRFSTDAVVLPSISLSGPSLIATGSGPGFQWYLDGSAITGATAITFEPTTNGTYTVEMTDALGCTVVSAPFQLLNVGVQALDPASAMVVAGPDAYGLLTVRGEGMITYELLDARGVRLKTGMMASGFDQIATAELASGTYVLVLRSAKGRQVFRFFAE
ncbi:MAG: hypothetical protein WEC15_04235 [Flavobacteriales bacterium]